MLGSVDTTLGKPSVSVIVTTFNRVKLLAETLNSILAQTYTDYEIIVIDNMSEDGTKEYIANLKDGRMRYFRNLNNGVIAVNRNYGIEQSQAKYIAFCDDDDLWLSDKLNQQITLLENNSKVAMCYTNAESFNGNQVISSRMVKRCVKHNHFFQLLRGNFIPNSSVVVRRQVFKELGLLTNDGELREDYHMWLRISKEYPIQGIDRALIRYRVHLSNVAGNRAAETLRAIKTLKSSASLLSIRWLWLEPNLAYQWLKYCIYRIFKR
jgi:glycosyltransferase involved in cell wall biosynthesis